MRDLHVIGVWRVPARHSPSLTILPAEDSIVAASGRHHIGAGGKPVGKRKEGALCLFHSLPKLCQTGTANRRRKESLHGRLIGQGFHVLRPPAGELPRKA